MNRLIRMGFVSLGLCVTATAQDPPTDPAADPAQDPVRRASDIEIPSDHEGRPVFDLELEEAMRIGIGNNVDLAAEELVQRERAEEIRIENAFFEPEFFADSTYGRSRSPARNIFQPAISRESWTSNLGIRQTVTTGGVFELSYSPTRFVQSATGFPARQYTSEWAITLTQPLLAAAWSDYALANVETARANTAAARFRYRRTIQDTLLSIVEAYWELVGTREDFRVIFQALELAEEQLRITNERIRVRELAERDRVSDEAEVARRREELIRAENAIRQQEDTLRRLLFGDGRWDRNLRPVSPIDVPFEAPEDDWKSVANVALDLRPDVAARKAEIKAAEISLAQAKRDLLPRLDLTGSYGSVGVANTGRTFRDANDDMLELDNPDWSVGLQLTIPIGNNAAKGNRDRAMLTVERQRRLLYALQLDVAQQVREALREVRTLSESVKASIEAVRLAETTLDTEREKLKVGRGTMFEVQQRNQELLDARRQLLRNKLNYRRAQAVLEHARGTIGQPVDVERR